jgi:hypothetical protein
MNNISISYLLIRGFMIDFCLLGFEIAIHGFHSFELTSYYVNLEILYQRYYSFLESVSKAWHTCEARFIVCGCCHVSNSCFGFGA